jgi:hypothetical protein
MFDCRDISRTIDGDDVRPNSHKKTLQYMQTNRTSIVFVSAHYLESILNYYLLYIPVSFQLSMPGASW